MLEGVQDRYRTPFFDNLKKYAQRPIGTFMRFRSRAASPCSGRAGSATWVSSTVRPCSLPRAVQRRAASTACLSRPATSRTRRRLAARRLRRRSGVLRHQRHLDVEQDGGAGAAGARRHRDRRSQLPQVASLRHGSARVHSRSMLEAFPLTGIFDVWRGAAAHHQEGAARPQSRWPRSTASRWST